MSATAGFVHAAVGAAGSARAREAALADPPPGWAAALDATAAGTALTGLIAMGEVNRLATGALSENLESRSITEISGPTAVSSTDVWDHWDTVADAGDWPVDQWISLHTNLDVLFFLGYGWLLYRLVRPSKVALAALAALLVTEVVEAHLIHEAAAALAGDGVGGTAQGWLAGVATAKWSLLLLVIVAALRNRDARGRLANGVVRAFQALRVQRLSLFIALVIGALSLIPAADLFDQFPDVVRGWFDEYSPQAVRHLVWGVVAYLLAGLALLVVGRQRSERSWTAHVGPPNRGPTPPTEPPQLGFWLAGPAVAFGVALWLGSRGQETLIDREVLAVFIGVPVGLVAVSMVIWWTYELWLTRKGHHLWAEKPNPQSRQRARDVWAVGDLLAVAMLVIGALAVVRALVAPLVVGTLEREVHVGVREAAFWIAAVLACLGPLLLIAVIRRADRRPITDGSGFRAFVRPSAPEPHKAVLRRPIPAHFWGAAILFQALLMVWPVQLAEHFGVVATAVLALVGWAVILGFLIVHFQHHRPLEIFRLFRLRANPVMTLLVIAPLVAAFWGGVDGLHDVRTRTGQPVALPQRMDMDEAFAAWLGDDPTECQIKVGEHRVRPMLLVAASGGGIRAATWTAGVVNMLGEQGPCVAGAAFLSSGVSGGSVGLVLARGDDPLTDLRELSRPTALAAALAGTLVGDLVAGSSGLRVPSRTEGGEHWRDRAALMESIWERDATVLSERYDTELKGPGGFLVLNSTEAVSGCRVLVSQVDLDGDGDGNEPEIGNPVCGGQDGGLAASIDVRDAYGDCTPDMTWATAAMLSARFPTVTPAGRLPVGAAAGDCSKLRPLQLIDGGYAESSGLGLLADIAPEVLQPVLEYNAARDAEEDPVVVPIVLYLEDEPRKEIAVGEEGLTPELLVPLEGQDAATVQITSATWLQRAAASYGDPCPQKADSDHGCTAAVAKVHDALTGGAVIAAPLTRPGVEAPLGWTLSDESRTRLNGDVGEQDRGCADGRGTYACTEELLDLLLPGR